MTVAPSLSLSDLLVLKPEQVAQLLSISRSTVYELIKSGTLSTITLYPGGPVRITREAVNAFLAARQREAAEQQATYLTLVAPSGRGQRPNTRR